MKEEAENLHEEATSQGEREIDLLELLNKVWQRKKLVGMWALWGLIAGLVIAFSIPREYTTVVKLAPESRGSTSVGGGLGALATMAGISTSANSGADAVYPQLYPDIVGSVPFATSLFDVVVTNKEGEQTTVRDYLIKDVKSPWWSFIKSLPSTAINMVRSAGKSSDGNEGSEHSTDNFNLTPEENLLVVMLASRVRASVDAKTNIISIETTMQDPVVSAVLVDTVVSRLREYVTNYRTNKARKDLEYALKLNDEARDEYYKSQQRLADYIDRNQNLATRSAQVTRDRLENEASLAFNLYNETSLHVQKAKSKVQETTPVYTEIIPATVPMRPTSPKKGLIIGGCVFLAVVVCIAWIIIGSPLFQEYRKKTKGENSADGDGDEK